MKSNDDQTTYSEDYDDIPDFTRKNNNLFSDSLDDE